ncbi:MAG: zinc ribbon domain-containing protein [Anaerolineae bacterium]|nr:zinc ribbon domain-containing protein [Anaerolineae bacterium]
MRKYFRATYAMQFVAALSLLVALFLPWHVRGGTAIDLIERIFDNFYFPYSLVSPWALLAILPITAIVSMVRGVMGMMFYDEVLWYKLAWRLGLFAIISMAWFYAAFGVDDDMAWTQVSHLRVGYWLTGSSLLMLVVVLILERIIPKEDPVIQRLSRLPMNDPERILSGYYRACPNCLSPNDPKARRCVNCGVLLFPDIPDEEKSG